MSSKKSNREIAYEYLKDEIISMRLLPGTPVLEQEVADILNISRTPVREAMHMLQNKGLLCCYLYQGTYVSAISIDDAIEICELRELLEVWTLRKSINFIDEDELDRIEQSFELAKSENNWENYRQVDNYFHTLIVEKSRSSRAKLILDTINKYANRAT
jgi:DNA-binding GntR family transcriptional regulator